MADKTDATPKKGEKLLLKLQEGESVASACRAQRISRATYYRWLKEDPTFAANAEDALEVGTDLLEDEAKRRAVGLNGSDTLLIFLLKARRPDKYRERHTVDVNVQIRKRAEQMAEQLGVPVDDLMAQAEAVASGAWDTWSPPQ
jgi:hypothetical protein